MTRSVVFASNKGGVGKTTLSTNVCAAYVKANPGKKVLYCDLTLTRSLSKILLGETAPSSMMTVIDKMRIREKKREKAIKFTLASIIPMVAISMTFSWSYCFFLMGVYVLAIHIAFFRAIKQVVNPWELAAKSTLAPNLRVLVGGDMLAKVSRSFPWKTAINEWHVPAEVDVVIWDLDNTLDDYATFAMSVSHKIIIPASLNLDDFERLVTDPRNNALFSFVQDLPAKLRPTYSTVIFNRLKVLKNAENATAEFEISAGDQSLRETLETRFAENGQFEHFTVMRELAPTLLNAMYSQKLPIVYLKPTSQLTSAYEGACQNLNNIARFI